jgi:Cft2 family RNA processing exonuclease
MTYEIISSGRKGNAIIANDYLLLDCGVNYKKIKEYLNRIKIIFISHSHT